MNGQTLVPPPDTLDDELVLLTPGPAGTSQRVKDAMLRGDLCHREPEFADLLARIRRRLAQAANLTESHQAVVVTGSGTAAMEMAVISSVRHDRAILVVNNGVYGDRLAKIARIHGITAYEVAPDGDELTRWTTPVDPAQVRAALQAHPDIDAVACVHHETTTGLINPVAQIGQVVADSGALFVVDAISSLGGEDQDLADIHADILCGSSNKGLHGQPGLAFLLCSDAAVTRLHQAPVRSLYLNAATYLTTQQRGEVPFTPAVQACYALDEASEEYFEQGGHAARSALYRQRAATVRAGFERLGLRILVAPEHRGNCVTMLHLPDTVTYQRLHDELKARGYVMYAGQGNLADRFFRICTLGEIPAKRIDELEHALGQALHAAGAR